MNRYTGVTVYASPFRTLSTYYDRERRVRSANGHDGGPIPHLDVCAFGFSCSLLILI